MPTRLPPVVRMRLQAVAHQAAFAVTGEGISIDRYEYLDNEGMRFFAKGRDLHVDARGDRGDVFAPDGVFLGGHTYDRGFFDKVKEEEGTSKEAGVKETTAAAECGCAHKHPPEVASPPCPPGAAENMVREYHGTSEPMAVGATLKARKRHANPVEELLESRRPKGAVSRLQAFFMTERPGGIFAATGGEGYDYIYQVKPVGPVTKGHTSYFTAIVDKSWTRSTSGADLTKDPKLVALADAYWAGGHYDEAYGGWEIFSPSMKVIKLIASPETGKRERKRLGLEAAEDTAPVIYEGGFATVGRDQKAVKAGRHKGKLSNCKAIWLYCHKEFSESSQEVFGVICLDIHGSPLSPKPFEVARGQRDAVHVDTSDVLRPVIATNAAGFVVVHGHPTGHAKASKADVRLTEEIEKAAKCAVPGVAMLDHVVIGASSGECYSIKEGRLYRFSS